jgi:hypothetical protein
MNAEQSDFIELENDLDATPETEALQSEILTLWNQYDQSEQKIAPLLYELCLKLRKRSVLAVWTRC